MTIQKLIPVALFVAIIGASGLGFGQECNAGGPYVADGDTLLLLHFDGVLDGVGGEVPNSTVGTFDSGKFGQGFDPTPGAYTYLSFSAAGNIDLTEGTIEFWIKPSWDGNDGLQHTIFSAYGVQNHNHVLIAKNSGNNLHLIFWDDTGFGEGPYVNVGSWAAEEWHHLGFTWDDTHYEMYVDAVLVDTEVRQGGSLAVDTLTFSHSVGDQTAVWGWGIDSVIDEFRISASVRCFDQIATPVAQVSSGERAALIALYNSTNGAGWNHNTNWRNVDDTDFNDPGTECTWQGVHCQGDPPHVSQIVLGYNNLDGVIPAEIGDLEYIQKLDVRNNPISGGIPSTVSGLPLSVLWLSNCQMTGGIDAICGLPNLYDVDLTNNYFSGPIPSCIQNLSNLRTLWLVTAYASDNNNFVEAPLPMWLLELPALESLWVGRLSGPVPTWIGDMNSLRWLALVQSPNLEGPIPSEIGRLSLLHTLDLRFTGVDGPLPSELCTLPSLARILLADADLSGSIPPCLGSLSGLTDLWLQANHFSGEIPPELGDLPRLVFLYLHDNQLEGPIPWQFGNLTTLGNLIVSRNKLSGEIPWELTQIPPLAGRWQNFSYNALHSDDPDVLSYLGSDWENTQTVAPMDVTATVGSPDSVIVSWTPILYTADSGGYRVLMSDSSGGPYTEVAMTADKTASSATIGQVPVGTHYFVVQTVTYPHTYNQNAVVSIYSEEVFATIVPPNLPPTVEAGGPLTGDEGSAVSLAAQFYDPDEGDSHTASIDWGDGTVTPGVVAGTSVTGTHVYADNGSYLVAVTVVDSYSEPGSDTTSADIANVAPEVGAITASLEPLEVASSISASAAFTDPGICDTHSALWSWGDGSTSSGVVSETGGSRTVTGDHVYAEAGVHTVTLEVTDNDGGVGSAIFEFVVIYDPDGGFVTGGGWIDSPEGAYAADPSLTGKATFGFVSKYKKGATVPTGNTEFQFKAGDLNFHSSTYQWLVVTGSDYARYKGSGTINGLGEYTFLIWAGDGEPDTFRIKIWEEDEEENELIVYDNGVDQPIAGGSIKVHTK